MLCGVWELASFGRRRRLVFVRLGASATWTTAATPALLAVPRTFRSVTLAGAALSEQLVHLIVFIFIAPHNTRLCAKIT